MANAVRLNLDRRGTERKLKEARAEFIGILDDAAPKIDGESV